MSRQPTHDPALATGLPAAPLAQPLYDLEDSKGEPMGQKGSRGSVSEAGNTPHAAGGVCPFAHHRSVREEGHSPAAADERRVGDEEHDLSLPLLFSVAGEAGRPNRFSGAAHRALNTITSRVSTPVQESPPRFTSPAITTGKSAHGGWF